MKVVIIAGGKGTRISSISDEIPKAMLPVFGKPVLEYQIELCQRYGFNEIIIIIGYLGNIIKDYFGNGSKWAVSISYFEETEPLGTAGALPFLRDLLVEDFFVFYGDTVMDIALDKMFESHISSKSDASLLLHPNDHPYDSDLVFLDKHGFVKRFFSKPHPDGLVTKNLVNAALYIISPKIIDIIPENKKSDFGKDIFPECLNNNLKLHGYVSTEYIKDMGTPERYARVSDDMLSGKVFRLNKNNKRRAIFLDRDGVVIKEKDLLHKPEDLELIEGVSEAIRNINRSEYLTVIVTNQPVIARNLCSIEELEVIHDTLETKLGENKAFIDAIYYCPHHPDAGYPEERKEYKIECECRKPKPGMLLHASRELNINLEESIIIGDRQSDIDAGKNAGLKETYMIERNQNFALLKLVNKILGL